MNVILNAFLVTGATSGGKLWPFAIYRRFLPIKITQSSRHYEGRFNVDEEACNKKQCASPTNNYCSFKQINYNLDR